MAREESGDQGNKHQAPGRPVRLSRWQAIDAAGTRTPGEFGLCERSPIVRDVDELFEPNDRANRAVAKPLEVRAQGLHASEEARRKGRGAPPCEARCQAHEVDSRTV